MDRSGINLWRQIGETLAEEIERGALPPGGRLPASSALAARFGVNRHTVLRAIAHLQSQGLLRVERGRGTYVVERPLSYRLDAHRRFEQNLLQSNTIPTRRLLAVANLAAPPVIAAPLAIGTGDPVVLVTLLGEGDGVPVNLNSSYFPKDRMPGIAEAFRRFGHGPTDKLVFSRILAEFGFGDFRRRAVRLRGRPPTPEEARHLEMPVTGSVLETEVTSIRPDGTPAMHAFTRFCAARVEFVMELD